MQMREWFKCRAETSCSANRLRVHRLHIVHVVKVKNGESFFFSQMGRRGWHFTCFSFLQFFTPLTNSFSLFYRISFKCKRIRWDNFVIKLKIKQNVSQLYSHRDQPRDCCKETG
jgi:hypothetical protein